MKLGLAAGGAGLDGLYINANNYWYSSGNFSVGAANNTVTWNGTALTVTGAINATSGSFSGNITLTSGTGTLRAGTAGAARVDFNSSGVFAYDAANANTTSIIANAAAGTPTFVTTRAQIGGWNIGANTMTSTTNSSTMTIDSTNSTIKAVNSGYSVGFKLPITGSVGTDVVLWAGQALYEATTSSAFNVSSAGVLRATGAIISGQITISSGTTFDSITAAQTSATNADTKATNADTKATNADTKATNAQTTATNAQTTATNADTKATNAQTTATNAFDALSSKISTGAYAVLNASNQIININSNGITISGGSFGLNTDTIASAGAGKIVMNGFGILAYNSFGALSFYISSNGDATFAGNLSAATGSFLGTLSSASNIIAGGTLTGSDIDIHNDFSTDRIKTSYNRNTPVSGIGVSSFGVNAIAMISAATSGVVSHWYPYLAAESDLGLTTYYWRNVRYSGSLLNMSDARSKIDITNSDLGLNFINLLRPVKYRKKYEPAVPLKNTEGEIMLDKNGNRIVDKSHNYEGERMHYGLIAQEVKSALDQIGVGDNFAGWALADANNPESMQNLAYDKFISPMIKSIQELSSKIDILQEELDNLKK